MTFKELMNHAQQLNREEKEHLLDVLTTSLIVEEMPQLLQVDVWRPQVPAEVTEAMMAFMRETEAETLEHA